MTVTVNLQGGLGNQLFGWACGFALARRLDVPLALTGHQIPRANKSLDLRKYELNYFGIPQRGVSSAPSESLKEWAKRKTDRHSFFSEKGFTYDRGIRDLKAPITLSGYFQSKKYFADAEGDVREYLLKGASRSTELRHFSERLGTEWLAVHIRRGDYLNFRNIYEIPGKPYYESSLDLLKQVTGIERIVVFSDEPASAMELGLDVAEYVGPSQLPHAGDSLLLMSQAKGFVASNSSFSWWAAFLAQPIGRLNIFPRPWFVNDRESTRDLLEPGWLSIGAHGEVHDV